MTANTSAHDLAQGTFRSTKSFFDYPCSHRQWRHQGHCAHVHGYSRSFHFVFAAARMDACGFVVDFGKLKWLKEFLEATFDHTLLISADDPLLGMFEKMNDAGACKLVVPPYGVGMEATARWLLEYVDLRLLAEEQGRCWVESCEVRENAKNSAIYYRPGAMVTMRGDPFESSSSCED